METTRLESLSDFVRKGIAVASVVAVVLRNLQTVVGNSVASVVAVVVVVAVTFECAFVVAPFASSHNFGRKSQGRKEGWRVAVAD